MLAATPALTDVWTTCLLAHRRQLQLAQLVLDAVEIFA